MKVLAHRGASGLAPENSLEAFALAVRLGADGVELDVQRCATGEVVVFHDADLARLAGDPRRVAEVSFAELRAVRLAGGARIPTLAEAYEAAAPLLVNVELKLDHARPTGLEAAVVEIVRQVAGETRTLFSCFHPVPLWRLRRLAPHLPRGLLFGSDQARPWRRGWHLWGTPATAAHPEHVLCTPGRVRRWHARGLAVNAWTVNAPERVRALADLGVDAVITDRPDLARAALARP